MGNAYLGRLPAGRWTEAAERGGRCPRSWRRLARRAAAGEQMSAELHALAERAEVGADVPRRCRGPGALAPRRAWRRCALSAAAPGDARNPYKGLRAFLEADSADFFGRELSTRRLVERVARDRRDARFLCVVGPVGIGEVVRRARRTRATIRRGVVRGAPTAGHRRRCAPGAHPLRELERGPARALEESIRSASLLDDLERDELGLARAVDRLLGRIPGRRTGARDGSVRGAVHDG